jgi:hypothetical protein
LGEEHGARRDLDCRDWSVNVSAYIYGTECAIGGRASGNGRLTILAHLKIGTQVGAIADHRV